MSSSGSAPLLMTLNVGTSGIFGLVTAAIALTAAIIYVFGCWVIPLFGDHLEGKAPKGLPPNQGTKPLPGLPSHSQDIEMGPVERPNIYEEGWGVLPLGGVRPLSHPAYLEVRPPPPAHPSQSSSQDTSRRLRDFFRWSSERISETLGLRRTQSASPAIAPVTQTPSVQPQPRSVRSIFGWFPITATSQQASSAESTRSEPQQRSLPSMITLSSASVSPEITPVPTRVRQQRHRSLWLRRLRRLRRHGPMLVRGAPNKPIEPSWRKPRTYSHRGKTFRVRQPRPLSPRRLQDLLTASKRRLAFHRQKALDRLNMTRTPPGASDASGSPPPAPGKASSSEPMDSPPSDLLVEAVASEGRSLMGSTSPVLPKEHPLDAGFHSEPNSLMNSGSPILPREHPLDAGFPFEPSSLMGSTSPVLPKERPLDAGFPSEMRSLTGSASPDLPVENPPEATARDFV